MGSAVGAGRKKRAKRGGQEGAAVGCLVWLHQSPECCLMPVPRLSLSGLPQLCTLSFKMQMWSCRSHSKDQLPVRHLVSSPPLAPSSLPPLCWVSSSSCLSFTQRHVPPPQPPAPLGPTPRGSRQGALPSVGHTKGLYEASVRLFPSDQG